MYAELPIFGVTTVQRVEPGNEAIMTARRSRLKPSQLELQLQQLELSSSGVVGLEQYQTPPHIASTLLWEVSEHFESIKDQIVLDLGCGNGILGIGCLLLGAKYVIAVDVDENSLQVAKFNAQNLGFSDDTIYFVNQDVRHFEVQALNIPHLQPMERINMVVMNPPFGTKDYVGIDAVFVEKALECAGTVYSMHKTSTRQFWINKGSELGVQVKPLTKLKFNLKRSFRFHKNESLDIEVDLLQFKRT